MKEIITILGVSGFAITGFVWLAKIFISKMIDAGITTFKHRLDKDLEVHKKNMDMMKIQYQIQYSSLHEKRGEVIAELYSLLYDLEQDLLYYTDIFQGPEWITETERDKKAATTLEKTKELFEKNRIYFDNNLCHKLEQIIDDRKNIITEMRKARIKAKVIDKKGEIKDADNPGLILMEQNKKVQGVIAESRKQLADEFRQLVGVPK